MALTDRVVFADQEQSSGVIFARSRTAKYSQLCGSLELVLGGDTGQRTVRGLRGFVPDTEAGMHTHTADVLLVVLTRRLPVSDDAGAKRVGRGFIRIPVVTTLERRRSQGRRRSFIRNRLWSLIWIPQSSEDSHGVGGAA